MKRSRNYITTKQDFDESYDSEEESLFCLCPFCEKVFEIKDDEHLFGKEIVERDEKEISSLPSSSGYSLLEAVDSSKEDAADAEMQDDF